MADNNVKVLDKAFKGYSEHIDKIVYSKLDKWCVEILRSAIRFRYTTPESHNFTGNLINSICVLLYRKSTHNITSYFGYDKAGLKLPIRREMSGVTFRKTRRKNNVHFRVDWDLSPNTVFKAENMIGTDESWGQNDAQKFSQLWLPKNPDLDFVICVAYTSEYASFVEHQRQTTGFLETESFVASSAIEWVGLKAA